MTAGAEAGADIRSAPVDEFEPGGGVLCLVEQFGPGGGPDRLARALAPELERRLGRAVVVENVSAGGDGAVGLAARTGAVLVDTAAFASRPVFDPRLEAAHAALVPLVGGCFQPYVLVAAAGSTVVRDLRPADHGGGVIRYAVPALGSATHVLLARLFDQVSRSAVVVPAPSSVTPIANALALVERREADLALAPIPFAQRWFDRGALAPVAVTTARRSSRLPAVPTVGEVTGVVFDGPIWYGFWVAAWMPVAERGRLASAIAAALRDPAMVAFLSEEGAAPLGIDGEGLASLAAAERDAARSLFARQRPAMDARD